MTNKQIKQSICSVLNRNGGSFGYYSLTWDYRGKYITQGSYALREHGKPIDLSRASVIANINQ